MQFSTMDGAEIREPILKIALDWWLAACTGNDVPGIDAVDPLSLGPRLISNVAIFDAPDADGRILVRLAGTAIEREFDQRMTRRYLDEFMPPEPIAHLLMLTRKTIETRRPVYSYTSLMARNNRLRRTDRLYLPLRAADGEIGRLLVAQIYRSMPPEAANRGAEHFQAVIAAT